MRSPLDTRAIEAQLHRDERVSIEEWCQCRSIAMDTWPHQPAARAWVDLAIARAVEDALAKGRARSRTAALRVVCGEFGLDGDSVRRRWERDRKLATERRSLARQLAVSCDA